MGVFGVDEQHGDAGTSGLVGDECLQLPERPRGQLSSVALRRQSAAEVFYERLHRNRLGLDGISGFTDPKARITHGQGPWGPVFAALTSLLRFEDASCRFEV